MQSKTLLIGLGKGGSALLPYLLAKNPFELVAVCDSNPQAIGVPIAERCGLPYYQDAVEAVRELRPDLVVDATGDPSLAGTLYEVRPAGTSVVTGEASHLLWELLTVQEEQRRVKFRFDRLMDDMHSALVVVQNGRIKFTNRTFHEMFGHSSKETLGHPYTTILAEDVQDRDMQLHRERMEGKTPEREYDTQVLHDDGSVRQVRVRARRTDWEGRPASLLIMHDVTELRRLQREREQFFRYMVHELRAPLSPVATTLELLRDPEARRDDERAERLIGILARSTDRLESFVRDFLELSRIEEQHISLVREPIDLEQVIDEVLENQRLLAEDKGLELTVEPWENFSVAGDEFVVETGVRNLVNNAIKYTAEGSVTVSVEHDESSFRLRVVDTGPGLTKEEQRQIFQEFGRIARNAGVKGTGLGLALVKKLVEAAGGRVWVESEGKDQGCTFTIELPRTFGKADQDGGD